MANHESYQELADLLCPNAPFITRSSPIHHEHNDHYHRYHHLYQLLSFQINVQLSLVTRNISSVIFYYHRYSVVLILMIVLQQIISILLHLLFQILALVHALGLKYSNH